MLKGGCMPVDGVSSDQVTRQPQNLKSGFFGGYLTELVNPHSHCKGGVERHLRGLVLHKFDAPEQALATDTTHELMGGQSIAQQLAKKLALSSHIADKIFVLDDPLHFKCRSTS
jgi:hypothetical protein